MDNDRSAEARKTMIAIHAGLMEGMRAIKAERGETFIYDVQTDTFVGGGALRDSGAGHYIIEDPLFTLAPPVILPAAIYLTIMQGGVQPYNMIVEESNTTMEEAFTHGMEDAIKQFIERKIPKNYYFLSVVMQHMGLLALEPGEEMPILGEGEANSYQELKDMQFLSYNMLNWMDAVARGEGIKDVINNEITLISPENVKKLQDMLRHNVTDGLANGANSNIVPISGLTYVSQRDKEWRRNISFCGYFPSDKPEYGIYIELIRQEQIEDPVKKDWPELGKGAAMVCKTIAEIFVEQGKKHLQTINDEPVTEAETGNEDSSYVPIVKAGRVQSVDGIGITISYTDTGNDSD